MDHEQAPMLAFLFIHKNVSSINQTLLGFITDVNDQRGKEKEKKVIRGQRVKLFTSLSRTNGRFSKFLA